MSEGAVTATFSHGIGRITIANADRRNAMSQAMWLQLEAHIEQFESNDSVRVIAIRGEGDRAFSAGADIAELKALLGDADALEANNAIIRRVQLGLEGVSKPTVAIIHGACVGGGFGIALACDLRLAASDAKFAVTPTKLGLLYSLPDTRRMLRTLGSTLTRDLLLTGRLMVADEAMSRGFLTAVCDKSDLEAYVDDKLALLSSASATALSGIKRTLNHLEGVGDDSSEELDTLFAVAFSSPDGVEGAAAFLEKRPAVFNQGGDNS